MDLLKLLCKNDANGSSAWGAPLPPGSTNASSADPCRNLSFWDHTDLLGSDPFKQVMHALNIYFTPVIILVGGAGNLLSFLVFTATHLKRQSSSIYLASLAIVDIVFLLSLTFIWLGWIKVPIFHRHGWCQCVVYFTYVTTFLSVWLVVSFTIERYIIVHYPLRKDRYCTPGRAKRVVVALGVLALLLYSFATFTSGVIYIDDSMTVCMPLPHFYSVLTIATSLDTALTLFLPSLIIVVLNVRMAVKIVQMSKQRTDVEFASDILYRSHNEQPSEGNLSLGEDKSHNMICSWTKAGAQGSGKTSLYVQKSQSINGRGSSLNRNRHSGTAFVRIAQGRTRAQHRTARMLIIVSSVFVLLNLPCHVFRIHAFFSSSIDDMYMTEVKALRWQELFQLLYHLNFSINFFLYSVYARQFRTGLRILYSRFWHKVHALQEHLTSITICSKETSTATSSSITQRDTRGRH